jgi:imidazole glycerol-phosphate synthase subunit HisH
VLDYGIGNLRSAVKALCHVGARAELVTSPGDVDDTPGVVLPGVGDFGRCRQALRRTGLDEPALRAIRQGRPFLGICVGFQLLYEGSEESPGVEGLAALGGVVRALPPGVKRPQIQWNQLEGTGRESRMMSCMAAEGDPTGGGGSRPWVYFIHSFAPEMTEATVALCDYGGPVVAAAESANLWGTQFHPEKSGSAGLTLLAGFVRAVRDHGRPG